MRAIAEEKRTQSSSEDQGHQFHSLKAEFGQTPESESLYSLFESFKEMAKKRGTIISCRHVGGQWETEDDVRNGHESAKTFWTREIVN